MRYWEEMGHKSGFNDGCALPEGIDLYRDVYIKAVNALAAKHGSKIRVVPFDRSGIHNPVLWMYVPKRWFEKCYLPKQKGNGIWQGVGFDDLPDKDGPEPVPDAGMERALEEAQQADLDEFVVVDVKVSDSFEDFLKEAKKAPKKKSSR